MNGTNMMELLKRSHQHGEKNLETGFLTGKSNSPSMQKEPYNISVIAL
jgi:hypothetical protein